MLPEQLSLCMIMKNEEKVIKRCLDSFQDIVSEIILIDTGSTDRSIEIAKTYPKVKLFNWEWIDDFSAARNYSFAQATKDWILWVDL